MELDEISPILAKRLTDVYGELGREWLAGLPALVDHTCGEWDVASLGEGFDYVGYSWVSRCTLRDGTHAVLKLAPSDKEFANEIEAMKLYGGAGAARLIRSDSTAVALLLERLEPGRMLSTLEDDVRATEIAGLTFNRLFRPLPPGHSFPTVERWGLAFSRVREKYAGGCGSFPSELFDPAERIYFELCASQAEPVLLHGDLHHFNILSSGQDWLAIDPKGLAGEPAYEVGALLRNRADITGDPLALARRRIDQLAGILGLDAQRLTLWAFSAGVLSALWTFEDHGEIGHENVVLPRALLPVV